LWQQIAFLVRMSQTKTLVLDAALSCFNERGFRAVTMRDIAALINLSPGNLAYHFRNKEALLGALLDRMVKDVAERLAGIRLIPTFQNIDAQLSAFFGYQHTYRFFFQDALELCRAHPPLAAVFRHHANEQQAAIAAMIAYSVGAGSFQAETRPGAHAFLARQVWLALQFGPAHAAICGLSRQQAEAETRAGMWHLVLPFLTPLGEERFRQAVPDLLTEPLPAVSSQTTDPA
jgi:AcrR family transcriptional regulator